MKAQLCKCNNCDRIYIDQNPSNQPELEVSAYEEIIWDTEQEAWVCPKCKVDDYLIDLYELPNQNNMNSMQIINDIKNFLKRNNNFFLPETDLFLGECKVPVSYLNEMALMFQDGGFYFYENMKISELATIHNHIFEQVNFEMSINGLFNCTLSILSEDSPRQFLDKLQTGAYALSITDNKVHDMETDALVGRFIINMAEETEYFDFILL